ncbi:MAG: STAS domain-containing protein [Planctomycetes bacterium]|nr:STAS domain-containing protein [Planctomycetota bacterium]
MQVTVEPRENFTLLHLRGEFDTFYCALLQKEIDGLIASGVNRIALNLRLVKFINSTALGAIIKASKILGANRGKLVISRPSVFCKDIIEKVGLDRVVPMFDSDEAAGAALLADKNGGVKGRVVEELEDETTILFAPTDAKRVEHFISEQARKANPAHGPGFGGNWRGVGRMSALDTESLRFTWNGGNSGLTPFEMGQMLSLGTDLIVKFRLPLLKKGHCEAVVTVSEVEERPDGVKLAATFSQIEPETLAAVKQYAADMAFLKRELRSATEKR